MGKENEGRSWVNWEAFLGEYNLWHHTVIVVYILILRDIKNGLEILIRKFL